jgi:dihydroorotase
VRYLIKNGSILDPVQRVINLGHVLIEDGKVSQVFDMTNMTPDWQPDGDDIEIIYAQACVVTPGFTDLHTHLREPGEEYKETIATGTLAAARGGFTTVCAMPNTRPAIDNAAMVRHVQHIARRNAHIGVDVIGALTLERAGTTLTEMAEMAKAGCIAFSDDGDPLGNPAMMRNAMAYASMLDLPVMSHCEDKRLNAGWAMHEGRVSTRLGLPGYPAAAEEAQIARDIALAELTGAHLHICHVSSAGGVALIRAARERGVHVTCEVTPHHLTLTDRWVMGSLATHPNPAAPETARHTSDKTSSTRQKNKDRDVLRSDLWLNPTLLPPFDTSTRVSPPLRGEHDMEALIQGVTDGTIDAIATDHAPHALVNKACEYGLASCGISGLETALALVLTLVHSGALDLMNVIAKFTEGPAQVLGRSPASLRPGQRADIVILDPEQIWTVDTSAFVSKGKNSPLQGQQLKGKVMLTMAGGNIVFRRDNFGKEDGGKPKPSLLEGILTEE